MKTLLTAGNSLEPMSYNGAGNGERECLKIKGSDNQQPSSCVARRGEGSTASAMHVSSSELKWSASQKDDDMVYPELKNLAVVLHKDPSFILTAINGFTSSEVK